MDRREMLAACAGLAAGGGRIDAIDVRQGDEPLCFVLMIPEEISPNGHTEILCQWERIKEDFPRIDCPLIILDGGKALRLIKRSDAEQLDG